MGDTIAHAGGAAVSTGRGFFRGSSGKWAGEQFMRAMASGSDMSPAALRTLDIMRNEEWKFFDQELIEGANDRLVAVADLLAAGLVTTIPNGLAKTVLEYDLMGDMDPANVSLDGVTRAENDRLLFETAGLPLPITHKDWYLNLRVLLASRTGTVPLDTTYIRVAGRKIAEATEDMLFNGGKQFGSLPIYGYTTHPNRNTAAFGTGGNWSQTAKTGDQVLTDVFTMIAGLERDGHFGPYWLYYGGSSTGTNPALKLAEDFKAASDKTIQQRILETGRISKITPADRLADNNVVLVDPVADTVKMISGEPLQTVQWDFEGGFQINFKGFQILVPLIRADQDGRSGIFHMS